MLLPRFSSKCKYLMFNANGHLKKLDNATLLIPTYVLAYILTLGVDHDSFHTDPGRPEVATCLPL